MPRRKRIRDATLHTFIYHYIFAAKSKSLTQVSDLDFKPFEHTL